MESCHKGRRCEDNERDSRLMWNGSNDEKNGGSSRFFFVYKILGVLSTWYFCRQSVCLWRDISWTSDQILMKLCREHSEKLLINSWDYSSGFLRCCQTRALIHFQGNWKWILIIKEKWFFFRNWDLEYHKLWSHWLFFLPWAVQLGWKHCNNL